MDLSDLNIVSIAPATKVQPVKRKKNNKYERRRQKAEKAKREKNQLPKKKQVAKPDNDNNGDATTNDSIVTEEDKKESTIVAPTPVVSPPPMATTDESSTLAVHSNATSTESTVSSTQKTKTTTKKTNSSEENDPKKVATKQNDAIESNDSLTIPVQAPSRRHRPNQQAILDDSAHAKYMAEYHARPMELDRRSGARSSSTGISKESKHLFVQDHKEWHDLHPRLIQTLTSKFQLTQPTTVQSRTIQTIQEPNKKNHNVLIHGETGSGKTLAYLLPILQQLGFPSDATKSPSRKDLGTKCIILCPTRELASQTLTVVEKLCQANFAGWMVPGGLLGGDSRNSEKARVRKGLAIIVATPGRLLDHLQKTESLLLNLKGKLQWLVLDEADRLLDMGLGDQVKQIVQLIRANEASKAQPWWRSVLVSATVTPSVQALAKERMLCGDHDWVWVKGGTDKNRKHQSTTDVLDNGNSDNQTMSEKQDQQEGYAESTPRQLAQFHITVTAKLRLSTLVSFLVERVSKGDRTVVFMATCASVDFHHKLFESMDPLWDNDDNDSSKEGLFGNKGKVFKLHGNVQHSKRNETLKHFDNAVEGAILLTTDVAARGLNLEGVDWTIQYDPPCEIADYVHRVGRVARAGKAGHSLLFLLPSEKGYLDVLSAKGISKVEPLSLSSTLNKAASYCSDWTNAGLKHGGNNELDKKRTSGMDNVRGSRLGEHFAGEVQRRMEDCIVQDNIAAQKKWKEEKKANKKRRRDAPNRPKEGELMELARDAFVSFLRAYPTKREPSVRSIFSARALHVGHVARSFALKDPPKSLVSKHKQSHKANHEMEALDQQANRPKSLQFDMYENNLVALSDEEHDGDDDDEDPHDRDENDRGTPRKGSMKRIKLSRGSGQGSDSTKATNAKALLLQNALKMQNNLMDAM